MQDGALAELSANVGKYLIRLFAKHENDSYSTHSSCGCDTSESSLDAMVMCKH